MKVELINYTPLALETLIFSKNTRLTMNGDGWQEVCGWPEEKKLAELEYMRHTIQSQFEFVDYIFSITGVTRAFTHQLVRHRSGTSFAQQSQRSVNMEGFEFFTPPGIEDSSYNLRVYHRVMGQINDGYQHLTDNGVPPQDARGVLPTNVSTNILCKGNLRTFHDMALKRLCVKTQGEFQDVFRAMRAALLAVHPWAEPFIRVWCATYGTCMFHNYPVSDCPVKKFVYNPYATTAYGGENFPLFNPDQIQAFWETNRGEAQPKI